MFEVMRVLLLLYSGAVSFSSLIAKDYPAESVGYKHIMEAHDIALKEFEEEFRASGEKYLRHLESTALIVAIVLQKLKINDPAMIVSALLHDILEDIPSWTYARLSSTFGKDVADLVRWISKRHSSEFDGDTEKRNKEYFNRLSKAPQRAVIIKLADQLHNLITLWAKSSVKQRAKVNLARSFYLKLSEKHNVLTNELREAIAQAEITLMFTSWIPETMYPRFK